MGFGYNWCNGMVSVGHRAPLYILLGFEANIPGIDQRRAHRLRTRVRTGLPYGLLPKIRVDTIYQR
jgi:hypothetical protein